MSLLTKKEIYLLKRKLKANGQIEKFCNRCQAVKPINEFAIHHGNKRRGNCKACVNSYNKKYYEKNGDKVRLHAWTKYHQRMGNFENNNKFN